MISTLVTDGLTVCDRILTARRSRRIRRTDLYIIKVSDSDYRNFYAYFKATLRKIETDIHDAKMHMDYVLVVNGGKRFGSPQLMRKPK